jgi:hypothetical protein
MTKRILVATAIGLLTASFSRGQEPSPSPAPTAAPSRSVRISFVPPPLEGKISLGVYNESGQLVRVLHQEAEFDEFAIGADALSTKWDGKDDYDYDLPAGKYSARGFLVAPMKIEAIAEANITGGGPPGAKSIHIKLVANPLENNERPTVDISAGFDDDDVYLQTTDGLPLLTIAKRNDAKEVWVGAGRDNKNVVVFVSNGTNVRQFEVNGVTKMMAFDCGTFELK